MKKIVRKIFGGIALFIGLAAGSALDSIVPFWATLILIVVFFTGFFGGCYLICKGEPVPEID